MKVKYLGESNPFALLNGKVYDVISVEDGPGDTKWYRIVDETEEDYLYIDEDFEIVSEA